MKMVSHFVFGQIRERNWLQGICSYKTQISSSQIRSVQNGPDALGRQKKQKIWYKLVQLVQPGSKLVPERILKGKRTS
jgi:hypothetical protein